MYDQKITINRLKEKIRFLEARLKAFVRWDAPTHLKSNKCDCMVALKNQLCLLKQFEAAKQPKLILNKER